jgi:hypothetical protein
MPPAFINEWLDYIRHLDADLTLLDSSLHHNFVNACNCGRQFDLRHLGSLSLLEKRPELAITIVGNQSRPDPATLTTEMGRHVAGTVLIDRLGWYPCEDRPWGTPYPKKLGWTCGYPTSQCGAKHFSLYCHSLVNKKDMPGLVFAGRL